MRVLIDECVPRALKKVLGDHGHECRTEQEAGWAGKKNGELLSLAETAFDALITFSGICGAGYGKKLRGFPIVARLKLVSLTIGVWTLACHKEQGHSFPRQVSNGGTHHD